MVEVVESILAAIDARREHSERSERFVIALAGPPAAGKSTVAAGLQRRLGDACAVLGLDAFHYDDGILRSRDQLDRKGSPATFDVDGFARLLSTLRTSVDTTVAIPRFDRSLELSRNCAELVGPQVEVLVVEGNYLLVGDAPWAVLRSLFDLSVMITAESSLLEQRLMQRWLEHGYEPGEAAAKVGGNDLINAEIVRSASTTADMTLVSGASAGAE